ncbi:retinol dehydrogenase 8-like [Lytechinus pictus]|uniref:retinol dehydrogenase 8-like n=1 Tax=Lytechinus pictus TaxID=7653 RepID=UPI0030B9B457
MPEIVFISGCSSGIGLSTAQLLAHDPQKRFLVYATILKPLEQEEQFRLQVGDALNDTLFPLQMDITKEAMIVDAIGTVMKDHGRIDIIINIAGVNLYNVTEAISLEVMKKVFDINFFGTVRVTQEVLPVMKRQRSGRIINMGSIQGLGAFPYYGLYGATKQAIVGFSQEIAIIGRFFNISVSVIEPGAVDTAITENMIAQRLGGQAEIQRNKNTTNIDLTLSKCFEHVDIYHPDIIGLPILQKPSDIAQLILKVATADKPHFRYQSSEVCQVYAAMIYKDVTGDSHIDYQVTELESFRRKLAEKEAK